MLQTESRFVSKHDITPFEHPDSSLNTQLKGCPAWCTVKDSEIHVYQPDSPYCANVVELFIQTFLVMQTTQVFWFRSHDMAVLSIRSMRVWCLHSQTLVIVFRWDWARCSMWFWETHPIRRKQTVMGFQRMREAILQYNQQQSRLATIWPLSKSVTY